MFEDLFAYPKVVARHRKGPEASRRLRYLEHCADQGAARGTLLRTARELLVIAERLDLAGDRRVGHDEIDAAAQSWAGYQYARNRVGGEKWSRRLFCDVAAAWLRFLGQLDEPAAGQPKIHWEKVADFIDYQRDERGLSASTLVAQRWHVETLLEHLGAGKPSIADIMIADVDAFLDEKGRGGWSRVSIATSAHALRAFFRHAERRQWCMPGIAAAIDAPRLFREEALPMGPAWPDVQRLLGSTKDSTARDIRDHAILKLLAIYGLRSGEVRGLRLEDVDWTREVITVTRSKQRKTQYYPLVTSVGDAIVSYLQQARPRCRRDEVFITLKAPFRPLSASAMYHVVASRLSVLGVQPKHLGPHGLRHACATHLVAQGLSPEGDRGPPGPPQRLCDPDLRQGRPCRTARGRGIRSGRTDMILSEIIASYVDHRQAIGMRFRTEVRTLKSFCRFVGDRPLPEVTSERILTFLSGHGPVTRFWERKHSVLAGFYRFAMARGHVDRWPLPHTVPKPPAAFVPYIYSRAEIRRLLDAVTLIDHPRSAIDPDTYRTLLLLLYGAGLRLGEALSLTLADTDLEEGILRVRESKFYKTRLVPISQDLVRILSRHVSHRRGCRSEPESLLFLSRQSGPVTRQHAERIFCRLRVKANVVCADADQRHQPRLHDLRHGFAVHRLIDWYRQGADVQRLLPKLSTYLGHVNVSGTQRYLTLTPDLLREAGARFEQYAMETPNE